MGTALPLPGSRQARSAFPFRQRQGWFPFILQVERLVESWEVCQKYVLGGDSCGCVWQDDEPCIMYLEGALSRGIYSKYVKGSQVLLAFATPSLRVTAAVSRSDQLNVQYPLFAPSHHHSCLILRNVKDANWASSGTTTRPWKSPQTEESTDRRVHKPKSP
jgi:hypothetical protein